MCPSFPPASTTPPFPFLLPLQGLPGADVCAYLDGRPFLLICFFLRFRLSHLYLPRFCPLTVPLSLQGLPGEDFPGRSSGTS